MSYVEYGLPLSPVYDAKIHPPSRSEKEEGKGKKMLDSFRLCNVRYHILIHLTFSRTEYLPIGPGDSVGLHELLDKMHME